ncbi:hypothetical protein ACOMHN_066501 [Nucella lapillus]
MYPSKKTYRLARSGLVCTIKSKNSSESKKTLNAVTACEKDTKKCRQCYCDGHKAGDPECKLPASSETKGSTDSPTTDTTDMLEIMDTKTGDKQKQDVKKTEKKQNKANSVVSHDRSRPRDKKKQTTLGTYRRSGSQSIKRPRSKDSLSSQSDKQMKLQEQNDHETNDDESEYCEPPDHIA